MQNIQIIQFIHNAIKNSINAYHFELKLVEILIFEMFEKKLDFGKYMFVVLCIKNCHF